MTLYELGEDYLRQNEIIVAKIHTLNEELKRKKGNDYISLKRDILVFYQMSRELRSTAYKLMHYYDRSDRRYYHRRNNDLPFTDFRS